MAIDPKININENQVIFKRDIGHKHDGLTSSLIDYTKYSMSDFVVYPLGSPGSVRRNMQERNLESLKSFIVDAIEDRVLNPRGIRIQANAITANEIASNTITAKELSANIVLINNVISSNNYVANTSGWSIHSNGFAEFGNATVRGTIVSNTGTIAGWTLSNTAIYAGQTPTLNANYSSLYSNGVMNLHTYTPAGFLTPDYYYDVLIDSNGITLTSDIDGANKTTSLEASGVLSSYLNITGEANIDQLFVTTSAGIGTSENQSTGAANSSGGWLSNSGFATFTRPGSCLVLNETTNNNVAQDVLTFRRKGSTIASITVSNTAVSYNTGSDYRLKTNIEIISNIEEILNKLKPVKFNWVSDPDQWSHGFIAHEIQEIIPYAVSGEKDGINEDGTPKHQQVDYSKITPILTAGIKMLMTKIDALEARLQALEDV
jgi:hypothetical protein